MDLVLSSGFLAFARHCGFLQAVEDAGLEVDALCGTSSGALVGSLWLAGLSARQIADELSAQAPLRFMRPRLGIWGGVFSLEPVLARLRGWLPARFEDLDRPLGVGVSPDGETAQLLTSGSLPEAVAASCAVPYLFAPVGVDGQTYKDGGAVDRLGLAAWRSFRGEGVPTLVHLVERSIGPETELGDIPAVRTPRSGAMFWSLGDFEGQLEEARRLARAVLQEP